MLQQSAPAAATGRGKVPLNRHRKRAAASRRRVKAADEPGKPGDGGDGNDGVVLFKPREATRLLNVSRQTLHNLIAAGELRVRRIGRGVWIPATEIRRLGAPGVTVTTKPKRQQAAE